MPLERAETLFTGRYQISIFNVDDAGAGDMNADGHLDVWTTNHSALQFIGLGSSDGRFVGNAVDELHLHQDSRLPGIEADFEAPACVGKRLYIEGSVVVLDNLLDREGTAFLGRLHMPWPSSVAVSSRDVLWEPTVCPSEIACTNGRFEIPPGGEIRVETIPDRSDGFPISLELSDDFALDDVRLGSSCQVPAQRDVEFALKDRHGLLLADFAGDENNDLFVSRGGARGRLNEIQPGALDEFFMWRDEHYAERIIETGITKEGCPGRQVAAVDIDGDNDLDIYQVCGRDSGDSAAARNRLYVQISRGRFQERAAQWGLAFEGAGSFSWVPTLKPGTPPRFVWATSEYVAVYESDGTRYRERWRTERTGGNEDALRIGDFNLDGNFDLAMISNRSSAFLELDDQRILLTPFERLGLPSRSIDGNFVDFNGDGRLELHLIPQGFYERSPKGEWRATGFLALGGEALEARSTWFDADGDGGLDLWLVLREYQAVSRAPWPLSSVVSGMKALVSDLTTHPYLWQAFMLLQKTDIPTHMAIRVLGPAGNRQAIGAWVVATGGGRTTSLPVGHSDGSRLSQTLHEVYIGIKDLERLDSVKVHFPDGESVTVRDASPNSVLVIPHPLAAGLEQD